MSYLFLVNSIFPLNPTLRKNPKKIYIIHNKENIIRNISRTSLFQQLLANKHPRLRDSVPIVIWPSGGLGLVTDKKTKKIKSRAEQEPRSAHGRAVNKSRAEQEPRSAHGRAVNNNNKSRVKQEPRSAHGRAVNNKSRAEQEPRSAHGRAVTTNKSRAEQEPRSAHGRAVNNYSAERKFFLRPVVFLSLIS